MISGDRDGEDGGIESHQERVALVLAFLSAMARESSGPVVLLGDPSPVLAGAPSDIDLAVPVVDRRARATLVQRSLDRLPWRSHLIQCIQHEAQAHQFVVAFQVGEGWSLLHPDLTTGYARVGRRFIPFEVLTAEARPLPNAPNVLVPSPEVAACYYVIKRVSKGTATVEGLAYLQRLRMDDGVAVDAAVTALLGPVQGTRLLEAVDRLDPNAFAAFSGPARARLYANHPLSWIDRFQETGRLVRRIVEPAGAAVAIYGTDGSGKGTLIRALTRDVGPAFRSVRTWHLFTPVVKGRVDVPVTDPHGRPPRSMPLSVVKLVWYLVLAWVRRAPRVALERRRAGLVLLDRDVDDLWIDQARYRFRLPEHMLKAALAGGPRPDLALTLHADAATVLKRSAEIDPSTLERLGQRYLAYGSDRRDVFGVDANASPGVVAFRAAGAVFAWLERRLRKRLGLTQSEPRPTEGIAP